MSIPTPCDRLDRRQFLLAGGTGLTLAALGDRAAAEDKKSDGFGGFVVAAQSYCFRNFNTEQALKRTHDLGLRYVEFYGKHAPPESTPEQIRALRKLCADYDVTPVAFGVQRFTKDHEANQKFFDFGKALGIRQFSADPEPDSFDSLDKLCEATKIAVAIHPHGPVGGGRLHRWYGSAVILPAVKDHHPLIGTCLDTGHLIRSAQLGKPLDPAAEVRAMGSRNFGMHLKDHDNKTRTDVVYGKGALDVPAVLRALKEVKFAGCLSIEYEAHPEEPSPDMRACLDVLRAAIKDLA